MSIRLILVLYGLLVACAGGLAMSCAPEGSNKLALATVPGGIALVAILVAVFVLQGIVTFIKRVLTVLVCLALAGGVGYLAIRYGGHPHAGDDGRVRRGVWPTGGPISTLADGTVVVDGAAAGAEEQGLDVGGEGEADRGQAVIGWLVGSLAGSGHNPMHVTILLWGIAGLSVGAGVAMLFAPARRRIGAPNDLQRDE